jgi:hypothetical protein
MRRHRRTVSTSAQKLEKLPAQEGNGIVMSSRAFLNNVQSFILPKTPQTNAAPGGEVLDMARLEGLVTDAKLSASRADALAKDAQRSQVCSLAAAVTAMHWRCPIAARLYGTGSRL